MSVYRDRNTVVALAAALLLATGAALVVAGSAGTLSGWGGWGGAVVAIGIGLLVLPRLRHTTTKVDEGARLMTIEQHGLFGASTSESTPFDAIGSVVGRHINFDDEYPDHMSSDRVDAIRDEIRASVSH